MKEMFEFKKEAESPIYEPKVRQVDHGLIRSGFFVATFFGGRLDERILYFHTVDIPDAFLVHSKWGDRFIRMRLKEVLEVIDEKDIAQIMSTR